MKAWEFADWFTKWLELARIEMADVAAEDGRSVDSASDADATSIGCAQLHTIEDQALAA